MVALVPFEARIDFMATNDKRKGRQRKKDDLVSETTKMARIGAELNDKIQMIVQFGKHSGLPDLEKYDAIHEYLDDKLMDTVNKDVARVTSAISKQWGS